MATSYDSQNNVAFLNQEFNSKVPMYYLDSGVAITFGLIKQLEDRGFNTRRIKSAIVRDNPSNIDHETADILLELYEKNKNGEVAFCIPPMVYKETMIDGLRNDNINKQYTRQFVKECCFLAYPNENIQSFARKSTTLQKRFKRVQSRDTLFGLNEEFKRVGRGPSAFYVDENFEDRMILSQIAVMNKQGRHNSTFISCSADVTGTSRKVQDLYNEEKRIDNSRTNQDLDTPSTNPTRATFIQINSKDFGTKVSIKGSNRTEIRGKREVARQLETELNSFFGGKGGLDVKTPLEL